MKDTHKLMEKHIKAEKTAERLGKIGERLRAMKLPPRDATEATLFDQILAQFQKEHAILQADILEIRHELSPFLPVAER